MRYINLDELLHAEKMKKLRHVVLHGLCDNQMLSILGQVHICLLNNLKMIL